MYRERPKGIRFLESDQWCQFKGFFRAGRYQVVLRGEILAPARLEVRSLDNQKVGDTTFEAGVARLALEQDGKHFFYVHLARGSELGRIEIQRIASAASNIPS